ncbi:MAG: AraC family transcriptional regulator [Marinobacter sp.]|uniref:AraC family transcriptional regulator n=1 Tax=Marinobacter sp. TaxID=50741 RepID=UPI00299E135D|nr:AraC family transcriptional regulator [Marinobacter sp.]MDX1755089.1 AraC family transcriptional regulator [Marinobacter sp.]
MSAAEVSHSPAIAQIMVNYATTHGVPAASCLANTGITPQTLKNCYALITREQEMRLIENLTRLLTEVPALGFELGAQYRVSAFGVWGFVLTTSRNLQEAVNLAIRYLPLSTAYCRICSRVLGEEFVVEFDPSNIPRHLRRFLLERDIATGVNILREINLASRAVTRLEFVGPPPKHAGRIEEIAGVPVHFRARRNRIVVPLRDAMEPVPNYSEHFVRQLEAQCRELLKQRQVSDFSDQVRNILLGKAGFLKSTEEVAKQLGISTRSLRRRLDAEGTSFRELGDEVRQQMACKLLATTRMKVEELAFHLGYSDAASFTRAFRRWQAISPGEYRKTHQLPTGPA